MVAMTSDLTDLNMASLLLKQKSSALSIYNFFLKTEVISYVRTTTYYLWGRRVVEHDLCWIFSRSHQPILPLGNICRVLIQLTLFRPYMCCWVSTSSSAMSSCEETFGKVYCLIVIATFIAISVIGWTTATWRLLQQMYRNIRCDRSI